MFPLQPRHPVANPAEVDRANEVKGCPRRRPQQPGEHHPSPRPPLQVEAGEEEEGEDDGDGGYGSLRGAEVHQLALNK